MELSWRLAAQLLDETSRRATCAQLLGVVKDQCRGVFQPFLGDLGQAACKGCCPVSIAGVWSVRPRTDGDDNGLDPRHEWGQ